MSPELLPQVLGRWLNCVPQEENHGVWWGVWSEGRLSLPSCSHETWLVTPTRWGKHRSCALESGECPGVGWVSPGALGAPAVPPQP